jgi:tRNA (guanine26-N2/guanine27-N2)-dimethyltransferase
VSQSHCYQQSIKTDAPPNVVWDVLRDWCKTNKPSKEKLSETSPGFRILAKEQKTDVSFEERPEATPFSAKFKFVRFQANPTENWGPQARPGNTSAGKKQVKREPKDYKGKGRTLETDNLTKDKKQKLE